MRSERDIKRTPRRPVARVTPSTPSADAPAAPAAEARPAAVQAAPGAVDAQGRPVVAVTIRPADERPARYGERAPGRSSHSPRDERPREARVDDRRRGPAGPQDRGPRHERGPDRGPDRAPGRGPDRGPDRGPGFRPGPPRGADARGFDPREPGARQTTDRGINPRGYNERSLSERSFNERGAHDRGPGDRGAQDRKGWADRGPRQDDRRAQGRPPERAFDTRGTGAGWAGDERRPERSGPRPDFRQDAQRGPRFDERSGARPAPRFEDRGQARGEHRDAPRPGARLEPRAVGQATRIRREDMPIDPRHGTPRPAEDGQRLSKILSDRGMASRREADDWIAAGWVRVDGDMAVLGQRVQPEARIEIDPAAHQQQAKRVTVLINKPIGYVSGQAEDGYEPASVLITQANHWDEDPTRKPFHPGHARGLAPAGRLDIDSTGLLVLTQDGRIAKHLIGEDSDVEKEYLVRVEPMRDTPFTEADLALLNHGLALDGKQLKPAKVSWANEDQLRFCLREGRKRQIRRMCELVGLRVTALKRVRIGSVVLGKLPPGQWRYLRDDERF